MIVGEIKDNSKMITCVSCSLMFWTLNAFPNWKATSSTLRRCSNKVLIYFELQVEGFHIFLLTFSWFQDSLFLSVSSF